MYNSLVTPIIVLLSIAVNIGCAQDSRVDSPQLAFESYRIASANNDYSSLYSTFSPGYRDYMIFEAVFGLRMDDQNKEAIAIYAKYVDEAKLEKFNSEFQQRLTNVLNSLPVLNGFVDSKNVDQAKLEKFKSEVQQQQLTDVQTYAIVSQAIQNKKGIFVDSMKYFERECPDDNKPKFGPLKKLVINKDVASAKTAVTSTIGGLYNDGSGAKDIRHETEMTMDMPVYFIKSNGKWLFATPTEWQNHNTQDTSK